MEEITSRLLASRDLTFDRAVVEEVVRYNRLLAAIWPEPKDVPTDFATNVPAYLQALAAGDEPPSIERAPCTLSVVYPPLAARTFQEYTRTRVRRNAVQMGEATIMPCTQPAADVSVHAII